MTTTEETKLEFLEHYGIKGMKWGVRRDQRTLDRLAGRKSKNPNYSSDQRKRDRQVYGRGGERRVNRRMNKGESISTARGAEKTRRDRVMGRNKYVRQGGKLGGGVVGGALGLVTTRALRSLTGTAKGRAFLNKILGDSIAGTAVNMLNTDQAAYAIAAGSGAVGYMLSGDLAVAANMRVHGYDPNRR